MRSIILSSLNKCHDQMADDPEPIVDPETEPRPETISDPPAEFRKRSEPKRCRPRSGAETRNDFRSIQDSIRSQMNHRHCRANRIYQFVAVTDPEPISKPDTDPESRPEPNPEDENAFRHKDIFYMKKEERKKMTAFVYKKDS